MRADACWGFGCLRNIPHTSSTAPLPPARTRAQNIFFFFLKNVLLLLFHRCDNNLLPSSPANLKPLTYLFFFSFLFFCWRVHHHISSEEARPHTHTHTSPLLIRHKGKREQLFKASVWIHNCDLVNLALFHVVQTPINSWIHFLLIVSNQRMLGLSTCTWQRRKVCSLITV